MRDFFKKVIIIFLVFFVSQTQTKTIEVKNIVHKEADPSQWVAVDGLGRTVNSNDGKSTVGNVNNSKEVGLFFWNWHDTEQATTRDSFQYILKKRTI